MVEIIPDYDYVYMYIDKFKNAGFLMRFNIQDWGLA